MIFYHALFEGVQIKVNLQLLIFE